MIKNGTYKSNMPAPICYIGKVRTTTFTIPCISTMEVHYVFKTMNSNWNTVQNSCQSYC